jgi:hypothetical protein
VGSASLGGAFGYNRKPPAVQEVVQRNRLRNAGRVAGPRGALGLLPWLLAEDLYRVFAAERKGAAARMLLRNYRQLPRLLRSFRPEAGAEPPPIAGGRHARSAWRRARGRLPPLEHDLDDLRPRRP